jgi:hypothetical protein
MVTEFRSRRPGESVGQYSVGIQSLVHEHEESGVRAKPEQCPTDFAEFSSLGGDERSTPGFPALDAGDVHV